MNFDSNNKTKYQEYFTKEHDMIRKSVREFVKKEITPNIEDWEEEGEFPEKLYKDIANLGFLGVGYPDEYGGTPGDIFCKIVVCEEMMRSGSAGLTAGLFSYDLATPPILKFGTKEQKERFVRPVLLGEKIAALAVTEPDAGSDVANIKTFAKRDKDHYIVNGSKTFITSGYRANQITCAVRTEDSGAHGISLFVIESNSQGYSVSKKLKKMGWLASDTAQIFFDNCKVPVDNLIGKENMGFYIIMSNFQFERLLLSVMANMTAQLALEESIKYAKNREAFKRPIAKFQVIKHKLADMATLIDVSREYTYRIAAKIDAGLDQIKEISMAKNFATSVSDKTTYDAVQIFGGYGFMRGYLVERLFRDNRVLSIGGGTKEIMNEIIAKKMF